MAFTPRFSLPPIADTPIWYRNGNWYYDNGYSPPTIGGNCTWYAYGRYSEVRNLWNGTTPVFANLSYRNACYWFDEAVAAGFNCAVWDNNNPPAPQLGAILCFKDAYDIVAHPGHVTVIEQINNDGSIVVSNSGYPSSYFWTATVWRSNQYREAWYTQGGRAYYCQGIIYNVDNPPDPPTPPTPPVPPHGVTPTQMPFIYYLRRRKL